jgi:hypothetical protein
MLDFKAVIGYIIVIMLVPVAITTATSQTSVPIHARACGNHHLLHRSHYSWPSALTWQSFVPRLVVSAGMVATAADVALLAAWCTPEHNMTTTLKACSCAVAVVTVVLCPQV